MQKLREQVNNRQPLGNESHLPAQVLGNELLSVSPVPGSEAILQNQSESDEQHNPEAKSSAFPVLDMAKILSESGFSEAHLKELEQDSSLEALHENERNQVIRYCQAYSKIETYDPEREGLRQKKHELKEAIQTLNPREAKNIELKYIQEFIRYMWYVRVGVEYSTEKFWLDLETRVAEPNEKRLIIALRAEWLKHGKMAGFTFSLFDYLQKKFFPVLENYVANARQQLHDKTLTAPRWSEFKKRFKQYLDALELALEKQKKILLEALYARIKAGIDQCDVSYTDVLFNLYQFIAVRHYNDDFRYKHSDRYPLRYELSQERFFQTYLYLLKNDKLAIARLNQLWAYPIVPLTATVNLNFSLTVNKNEYGLVILCPTALKDMRCYNISQCQQVFADAYALAAMFLVLRATHRYILNESLIDIKQLSSKNNIEIWQKSLDVIQGEMLRIRSSISMFFSNEFKYAWLTQLAYYQLWLFHEWLNCINRYLQLQQEVYYLQPVITVLQQMRSSMQRFLQDLPEEVHSSYTNLIKSLEFQQRLQSIEARISAVQANNNEKIIKIIMADLSDIIRKSKSSERIILVENIERELMPYLSPELTKALQHVLCLMKQGIGKTSVSHLCAALDLIWNVGKFPEDIKSDFRKLLLNNYLLPNLYVQNTPVFDYIQQLDQTNAKRYAAEVKVKKEDASLFLRVIFEQRPEKTFERDTILLSGTEILLTLDKIYLSVFLVGQPRQTDNVYRRRLVEDATAYVQAYTGDNDKYLLLIDAINDETIICAYETKRFCYLFEHSQFDAIMQDHYLQERLRIPQFRANVNEILSTYYEQQKPYSMQLLPYWLELSPEAKLERRYTKSVVTVFTTFVTEENLRNALYTLFDLETLAHIRTCLKTNIQDTVQLERITSSLQADRIRFPLSPKIGPDLLKTFFEKEVMQAVWCKAYYVIVRAYGSTAVNEQFNYKWLVALLKGQLEDNESIDALKKEGTDLDSLFRLYGIELSKVTDLMREYLVKTLEQLKTTYEINTSVFTLMKEYIFLSPEFIRHTAEEDLKVAVEDITRVQKEIANADIEADDYVNAINREQFEEAYTIINQKLHFLEVYQENKSTEDDFKTKKAKFIKCTNVVANFRRVNQMICMKFAAFLQTKPHALNLTSKMQEFYDELLINSTLNNNIIYLFYAAHKGANINKQDATFARTVLHRTAYAGKAEAVRALVELGADITLKSNDHATVLHSASASHHAPTVLILLNRANTLLECRDNDGYTPFLYAVSSGDVPVAEAFLHAEANVNARNRANVSKDENVYISSDDTALHYAVRVKNHDNLPELLELLIKNGANCDAQNSEGCTPFFRAIQYRNRIAIPILLMAGADYTIPDKHGRLPLSLLRSGDDFATYVREQISTYQKSPDELCAQISAMRDSLEGLTKQIAEVKQHRLDQPTEEEQAKHHATSSLHF